MLLFFSELVSEVCIMNNKNFGDLGEKETAKFLQNYGYQILTTNYRCKLGEIDIIARFEETIIFVEVKTRKSLNCGYPAEAVHYRKQQKIIATALNYLRENKKFDSPCRFDVMEVLIKNGQLQFHHIKDAFNR